MALFPGTPADGMAAAQALAATLRGPRPGLAQAFPAATFGAVHMEVVSAPFLVRPAVFMPAALCARFHVQNSICACTGPPQV